MKTIKLKLLNTNKHIIRKQNNYSIAFRKLYKHNILTDENFNETLKKQFKLSVYEFNCLQDEVEIKIKQVTTNKALLEQKIIDIQKQLLKLNDLKQNKKLIRKRFKLNKKLSYFNKTLPKDIVFGTKKVLKQLSFLHNDKKLNEVKIKEVKQIFRENRLLPITYTGSKNDLNSNRYFNFDFFNNEIIYKPLNKIKIELTYKTSKKYKKDLIQLQEVKDLKVLPISVKLTHKYICLSFNEEILNGFGFNEKAYNQETKYIKDKEVKNKIAQKYRIEQEQRKLKNKNAKRYFSIDLNPEYIGCSVLEKTEHNFKIIDKYCYSLTELIEKTNKASDDDITISLNNKRKHEIALIYKSIFNKLKHYNCSHFVIEDLDFKSNNENESQEFNRKTKNIWNRELQLNLINKHCNENGYILVKVNPVYTSFIGNLSYSYFDPVNAAIEIGRCGIYGFIKGKFYPELSETILNTMAQRFKFCGDVSIFKGCKSWVNLYKLFKETKFIYRFQLCDVSHNCLSKDTKKSKVKLLTF